MKTILFYSCLILGCFVNAQPINIPDANFKAVLLAANSNNSIAAIGDILPDNSVTLVNVKIDTNNNGLIEVSEVEDITYLFIQYSNISDLTGIEYFVNLKYLFINNNNISTVDNLYGLTQMERLFCNTNQISTLNIDNFTGLRILGCSNNQISTLNFSNNPILIQVYCGNNQLTNLDFSTNPLFNDLGCKNNPNLTSINIKNGTSQLFGSQTVYNECWTGCPNLTRICADSSEMNTLQTYLSNCGVDTFVIDFTSNCNLGNEAFIKNELIIYPNPFKNSFKISVPNLSNDNVSIKVYDMLGKTIEVLDLSTQDLSTLELGKNYKSGVYTILVEQGINLQTLRVIKE